MNLLKTILFAFSCIPYSIPGEGRVNAFSCSAGSPLPPYTACYCCHLLVFPLTSCKATGAWAYCLVFTYHAICAATCLYCTQGNAYFVFWYLQHAPVLAFNCEMTAKGNVSFWLPQRSSCISIINKNNQSMTDNCLSTILTWQIILNHTQKCERSAVLCIFDCPPKSSSTDCWIAVHTNCTADRLFNLTSSSFYPHHNKLQTMILTNILLWLLVQMWQLSVLLISSV